MSEEIHADSTGRTIAMYLPAVRDALQHLEHIGALLKSKGSLLTKEDRDAISPVCDALMELNAEVDRLHEKLEIASIQHTLLANKLAHLRVTTAKEIEDAVNAAKQKGRQTIEQLTREIELETQSSEELKTKYHEVQSQIEQLQTDKQEKKNAHDSIMEQVNKIIGGRSAGQMELYDIQKQIAVSKAKITQLEEEIDILREECAADRSAAEAKIAVLQEKRNSLNEELMVKKLVTQEEEQKLKKVAEEEIEVEGMLRKKEEEKERRKMASLRCSVEERELTQQIQWEHMKYQRVMDECNALKNQTDTTQHFTR